MNKTRHVLDSLRAWHDKQGGNGASKPWVFAEEVRVATGFSGWPMSFYRSGEDMPHPDLAGAGEQRIDAFAAHTWPSKKGLRVAFEAKTSKSDLKRELDNPAKCAAAMALSNEFYLVVPDDLVVVADSLPKQWGLIRVGKFGEVSKVKTAEHRDTPLPPYSFMLSLARNLQNRR